jgi:hypothetical protein
MRNHSNHSLSPFGCPLLSGILESGIADNAALAPKTGQGKKHDNDQTVWLASAVAIGDSGRDVLGC